MDVLNSATLLEAMDMCDKNKDVNICIAFKSLCSLDEFVDSIHLEIKAGRIGDWKINRGNRGIHSGYSVLKSKNDSFIHLIDVQAPELWKSRSFHWVLYEDGISWDVLQSIVSAERLPLPHETEKNEELDNFLNSFKIVNPTG